MLSRRTRELGELTILLEASEARLNCHRFWRADIGRDLFGDWRADIAFGSAPRGARSRMGLRRARKRKHSSKQRSNVGAER
jgi:hypothetical protein